MKKLLTITIVFLLMAINAQAIEFNVTTYYGISKDSENIVQPGMGAQFDMGWEHLFFYLSTDTNPLRFSGQRGINVNMDSFGLGFRHDFMKQSSALTEFLIREGMEVKPQKFFCTLSIDGGWYEPRYDKGKRYSYPDSTHGEGIARYLNKELASSGHGGAAIWFPEYSSDYAGAFGAKIGVSLGYNFTENVSLGMSLKYRHLQVEENLKGYDDPLTHGDWHFIKKRSFDAAQLGIMFKVEF